jgi:hypothetical protein
MRLQAILTENGASPTRPEAMASFCNYTHHELQNTSGLERHGHGVLFPYNPEFYDRASGLYGPGTIIAWNMADLIAAGSAILILGYWLWTCYLWLRGDRETRAAFAPGPQDENRICSVVLGSIIIGLFLWAMNMQWLDALRSDSPWLPDLGVALSEQDQLAALIAASMSLCYTLYGAVGRIRTGLPRAEVGQTVELHDSLLPGESHDVEALVGARRINTM